jgi:hypothetical protein
MDMQVATVTKTTDKTGYFTYSFLKPIDEVMVSVNSPQGGTNKGVVSASVVKTGANTVKVRVWVTGVDWTTQMAVSTKVTVTLLGITNEVTPPPPPPDGDPKYTLTTLDHDQTPNMSELVVGSNDGGATVRQEVWNPDPSVLKKQVTEVWSPSHWRTTINAAADNTAVNSYPDVSSLVTDTNNRPIPVSNYASIMSSWSVDCHETSATDAQAAYDIWLNNYNLELMIWVDTHGADRQPAGRDTGIDVIFGGVPYRLWAESDNSTISFVRKTNAQQGSIDILTVIQYLITAGRYPADVGVNMFTFGFETPSTGGVDEVFEVKDYTLVTTAKPGKTI